MYWRTESQNRKLKKIGEKDKEHDSPYIVKEIKIIFHRV